MCLFSEDIPFIGLCGICSNSSIPYFAGNSYTVPECTKEKFHLTKIIFIIVKLIYDRINLAI